MKSFARPSNVRGETHHYIVRFIPVVRDGDREDKEVKTILTVPVYLENKMFIIKSIDASFDELALSPCVESIGGRL